MRCLFTTHNAVNQNRGRPCPSPFPRHWPFCVAHGTVHEMRRCFRGLPVWCSVRREKVWALRATDCSVRPSSSGGAATSSLPPAAAAAACGGRESEASGPVPTAPPAAAAAGQCTPQREPQQSSQQGRTGEQSQQQQPAFGDPVATEDIIKRRPSSGVGETPHRR